MYSTPLSSVNFRNVSYTSETNLLNCEIEHPTYGWIPFGASSGDVEEHGRDIYQRISNAIAEGTVTATPYVAPPEFPPLTTEQKIARAGFDEGELTEYLVAKIQQRLNE
jgi:hypothetical protein